MNQRHWRALVLEGFDGAVGTSHHSVTRNKARNHNNAKTDKLISVPNYQYEVLAGSTQQPGCIASMPPAT